MLNGLTSIRNTLLLATVCAAVLFAVGCDHTTTPNFGGFFVITDDCGVDEFGIPFCVPHPDIKVNGAWVRDIDNTAGGNILNFPTGGAGYITTDSAGHYFVQYGRMPAVWNSGVVWNVPCGPSLQTTAVGSFEITQAIPYIHWDCGPGPPPPPPQVAPTPQFSLVGSTPATITVPGTSLSTKYGMPQLYVYNYPNPNQPYLVSQETATSVSADGSSATFSFPKASNGSPVSENVYKYGLWNVTSSGVLQNAGLNLFSVGLTNTSYTTPYGVDAVNVKTTSCSYYQQHATCSTQTTPYPLLTLSSVGEVLAHGSIIGVGNQPVAIKSYKIVEQYQMSGTTDRGHSIDTFQPSRAIVANFGSNTVGILDLINKAVMQTIVVGTQPAAVLIKGDESKAYVANFGSSTVSEIDLSSNTQSRVAPVGTKPEALAMDPSGTALWVGGLNYITKLDLNSFSAIQSLPSVSGQVTSLAVSAGQNAVVYTTVATAGSSTTFQAKQAAVSSGTVQGTYAQYSMPSSTYYAEAITLGGPAPGTPGWHMSGGALVSANYGNATAVIGTPTGFVVLDLVSKTQIMQGSTPSAIRGIATDPSQGIVYATAPDTNTYITIPLPKIQ